MLEAKHSKLARVIFNPYINRLLRKSFSHFYLVNKLPDLPSDKSLLVTPNHISWWDGFFIDYVSRKLFNKKLHLMMLESSLQKYWFFNKLGAYSIEPESNRSVLETMKYTRQILTDPQNFVVTYPQGEIEPFEKRPPSIKSGLRLFINENPHRIVILPVGFKIQFYNKQKPAVICRFGELIYPADIINNFKLYEALFTDNLNKLNEFANKKEFNTDLFE